MATGLIALLDDVAALAKVAAASLDDAAAQAVKVGGKATGIVIDDAAVTPRYVVDFPADRELPIIAKIAAGSLKNKLVFLLPGAVILSFVAPWVITPLLMIGGAYLCLEGYHKVLDLVRPHHDDGHGAAPASTATNAEELEAEKVASAIRTDFILSAEIMAISIAAVQASPWWLQAAILAVVAVGMTGLVYGAVALIVKADDAGVVMARSRAAPVAALGRAIVIGMPRFLKALSLVGMAAMLWVGGQILIHGLHELAKGAPAGLGPALAWPEEAIHHAAEGGAAAFGPIAPAAQWAIGAFLAGIIGLAVGAAVDPLVRRVIAPTWRALSQRLNPARAG